VTSIDAAPRRRFPHAARHLTVELFDGQCLAASDWPSITAGCDLQMHVYQSREFLDVWMSTIGRARGIECHLVVIRDRDKGPVLYLPLAIETKYNVRLLRFMDGGVADFNGPILLAGQGLTREEFARVWAEILSLLPKIDAIDLQKISRTVSRAVNPLCYLECHSYKSSGHAIRLGGLHQELYARPSVARMRKKLRRQHERLHEIGSTDFTINPAVSDCGRVIDSLIDLKHQQYLRTTGRDFFAMAGVVDFYRAMARPERLGRISHLSALTCGSEVVSAHLGFIGREQFYYVLPAFDTHYRSFAVGHMLLHHLIEQCFEQGYKTFDLGEGDFSYKARWATHRLPLCAFEQALTAAGLLYLQMRRVRHAVGVDRIYDWYARRRFGSSAEVHSAGTLELTHEERTQEERSQDPWTEIGDKVPSQREARQSYTVTTDAS
jgi:CelD/BcsL family acetyltransferase involved in cellulose biosynthesis